MQLDQIKSNWEKFENFCSRLNDKNIDALLEELGERLIMCPASPKEDQHGCYPGGLIEHAMEVASLTKALSETSGLNIPIASIIKVGLLHEVGKVGDLSESFFVEQDSEWHRDKLGQLYKYNENLNKMSISHRTLFLLQHFGVSLNQDEWLAIQLSSGSHFEENRFYVGNEPSLALILQHAKQVAIHRSKHK